MRLHIRNCGASGMQAANTRLGSNAWRVHLGMSGRHRRSLLRCQAAMQAAELAWRDGAVCMHIPAKALHPNLRSWSTAGQAADPHSQVRILTYEAIVVIVRHNQHAEVQQHQQQHCPLCRHLHAGAEQSAGSGMPAGRQRRRIKLSQRRRQPTL